MNIPIIELSGSAYEKGFRHGSVLKKQVLRSYETYMHRFSAQRGLTEADVRRIAGRFIPVFAGEYASYAEEMRGIADGAGIDFLDVLALNLRSELLYSGLKDMKFEPDECTAFAAIPPATKDGCVIAGQSWDFTMAQREAGFIAKIPAEDDKPSILMFLEGGMVGGKGVSSAGMCLTLNALTTPRAGIGVPLHVRMRSALECEYMGDAFKKILVAPIPVPVNLMLTHKDGLGFSIELDPEGADIIDPQNGILAHTNHYIGNKLALTHQNASGGSTYMRLQRIKQLMRSKPKLTVEDFEGFLRDHAGYPCSICAHPDSGTPKDELEYAGATNYAFVTELKSGKIRFVMGNPCEGEFEDIKL